MSVVKVIKWAVSAFVLIAAGFYFFVLRPQLEFAPIATAYAAKKVCSCIFVTDRPLEMCEADFVEDVSAATFTVEDQAVRIDILGGRFSDRAEFTPGQGCRLVDDAAA